MYGVACMFNSRPAPWGLVSKGLLTEPDGFTKIANNNQLNWFLYNRDLPHESVKCLRKRASHHRCLTPLTSCVYSFKRSLYLKTKNVFLNKDRSQNAKSKPTSNFNSKKHNNN